MNQPAPPSPPPIQHRNWWDRNWGWVVPTGCLGMLVVIAAFVAAIVLIVFGTLKSSEVYKTALARAKAHPAVTERLGTPVEDGFFFAGNLNVTGPSGTADLAIPISGPNGKGTIYLEASLSAGQWNFSLLEVAIKDTGERINLIE